MVQADYKRLRFGVAAGVFASLLKLKPCGKCGKSIQAGGNRQYCSDCATALRKQRDKAKQKARCRTKTERKPYQLKQAAPKGCVECGAQFLPKMAHQKHCSDKCRNRASSKKTQMERRNSEPRPCAFCSKTFIPEYGSLRRGYCTTECRDEAKRKVRNGSSHRRRAKKFGCAYEPVSKLKVFERDGWKCYLCGCDTPRQLSGTMEPNAPELEHVVPLSAGGAHSYDNTRCACRQCNRVKGADTPAPVQS
jgi:hypothetical protein